jgi:hypothetical protein
MLEPLFRIAGIEWYNLQVGDRVVDSRQCHVIKPPARQLVSFADTADFMMGLDYVVSVDTAVAHLAGRLNVPTFVLLRYSPDWRWGMLDTTPWYPSLRLIRQKAPDDWPSAIEDLARRLTILLGSTSAHAVVSPN